MEQITLSRGLRYAALVIAVGSLFGFFVALASAEAPEEKSIDTPQGVRVSVKTIGPVGQTTDLQIICILKHNPAGDKYIEAMKDLNEKLGGLLSSLRDRGDFGGEMGETLLFTPPPGSITPTRVLLIGVGEESALTLDRMRLVGAIAAREAIRLRVTHASFAPGLRDQGSVRMDVGEVAAAVTAQFLLAFDTEKRLEAEKLSAKCELTEFTIESGKAFFEAVAQNVTTAIATANFEEFSKTIAKRGGRSGLRVHVLPYPLNERFREEVDPVGREHFQKLIVTMGAEIDAQNRAAA